MIYFVQQNRTKSAIKCNRTVCTSMGYLMHPFGNYHTLWRRKNAKTVHRHTHSHSHRDGIIGESLKRGKKSSNENSNRNSPIAKTTIEIFNTSPTYFMYFTFNFIHFTHFRFRRGNFHPIFSLKFLSVPHSNNLCSSLLSTKILCISRT